MATINETPPTAGPGTRDAHRFDLAHLVDVAAEYGIDTDIAAAAGAQLATGHIAALGINGKLASGKDTVAPAVMETLGIDDAVHVFYAKPLKAEMARIIGIIESSGTPQQAARNLWGGMDIPLTQAAEFVRWFFNDTRDAGHGLDGYSRTPAVRSALQFHGTEVRRSQDEEYWVKQALRPAFDAMAAGRSAYITDVRFPNEVLGAQRVGFTVVRLQVTRATQVARLSARDGLEPDLAALNHVSETALDDYQGFNAVIDNNGTLEETVAAVAALVDGARARVAA